MNSTPGHADLSKPKPEPSPQKSVWPNPLPNEVSPMKYEEAQALLKKRQWSEASLVLKAIVEENPESLKAAVDLSRAFAFQGRREEALEALRQAMLVQKNSRTRNYLIHRSEVVSRIFFTQETFDLYQEGLNRIQEERYRDAKTLFQSALEKEKYNVEVLLRLGQCLMISGDYETAAEKLKLAKRLNPHEPMIRLWYGRALYRLSKRKKAKEELQFAHKSLSRSELSSLWLAEAFLQDGNSKKALEILKADLKKEPFHLLSSLKIARIHFDSEPVKSKDLWQARKELQLALSRFEDYQPRKKEFEGELGIYLYRPDRIKKDLQSLLKEVHHRLELMKNKKTS